MQEQLQKEKINWKGQKEITDTKEEEKMGKTIFTASSLLREQIFSCKSSQNRKATMKCQMQLLGAFCERFIMKLVKMMWKYFDAVQVLTKLQAGS